ncbi:ABC transporter permease [Amycolatopsis sp. WAC 01375]|uniref:ABC transporter permease n=1 Tax=Amycolatopsis sp. WAC 01375 TaxID=2203194 RepID=UPI000F77AF0A|nr:ABC transporter permease [Amycolatopsis sp. WAC 01375]RSM69985.1 ABC transporter permease [Amycolatopsis sp. WAC 01375]
MSTTDAAKQATQRADAADEAEARRLEDEQRLAEAQEERGGSRPDWSPLPRRAGLKPNASPLFSLRTPIPARWRWTLAVASFVIPLLIWVTLNALGTIKPTFLPTPVAVFDALLKMIESGELFSDLWATTQRVLLGFGLAVLVSVPLGIVMGTFDAGLALFEPVIAMLRYLPASAFIPLLMIWLGLGEPSKVAVLFLGTVFFNTLMTADAVRGVPRSLIDVSYTLGARRGEVLRKVIVPHALPGMIDATRVNAAAAWNFVVVAELINATAGLGLRIMRAQRFTQTDRIFALLIVIGLLGLVIDIALRQLRARVGKWAA